MTTSNSNFIDYRSLSAWYLTGQAGGFGQGGTTSVVGGSSSDVFSELEDLSKILTILESRKRLYTHPEFTVAQGNFLPSSVLQQGARLSLAVCRIARYFSLQSFRDEISKIKKIEQKFRTVYQSSEVLKEIFSIPDEDAKKIFREADRALDELTSFPDSELSQILERLNPIPWGTGFLVGGNHLLTNFHLLCTKEDARRTVAQFNVRNPLETKEEIFEYQIDSDALFVQNSVLDYTLVQLKIGAYKKLPGYHLGWIPLVQDEHTIAPGIQLFKRGQAFEKLKESFDKKILELKEKRRNKIISPVEYFKFENRKINDFDGMRVSEVEACLIWPSQEKIAEDNSKLLQAVLSKRQKKEELEEAIKELVEKVEANFQIIGSDIIKITSALDKEMQENKSTPIDNFINPNSNDKDDNGEPVFIIQHPKGRTQEIVLFENRVINNGLLKNYLRYTADADYGSSGSPVFNAQWNLVALHHAAIPNLVSRLPESEILANQGIRICRIIEDLKYQSRTDSQLKAFIKDFITTAEQLQYPPLPAAFSLNGLSDYIQLDVTKPGDSQNFSVEAWINLTGQQEKSTIFTAFCQEVWAEEESTLGDVLLHCYLTLEGELVLSRKKVFSSYPASSLLFPASCLDLFYPKRYPAPPSLRVGEKGPWIRAFKKFVSLIPGLKLNLETTDEFSEKDAEVIKKFQENHKLQQDGIVGYKTLDALWREIRFEQDSAPRLAIKDIRYLLTLIADDLMIGDEIMIDNKQISRKDLERLLKDIQSSRDSEIFCDQTKTAIQLFQKRRDLNPTGNIDFKTLDSLWSYGLNLRKGNEAQSIKDLKRLLKRLGDLPVDKSLKESLSKLSIDENQYAKKFDASLVDVVNKFQEYRNLGVDGVFGQRTLNALMNDRLYAYELRAQKFDWFVTKDFIGKFQEKHGLTRDGLPGRLTIDKMNEETKLPLGVYSHVAVTYDGQTIRLLVNGKELIFSKNENADPLKRNDYLKLGDTSTYFLVGAYAEVAERIAEERSCHFQGNIADLRIWKRDRTEEIETELKTNCFHRRLTGDEAGLIGYWRFEEAEISVMAETSTLEDKDPTTNQLKPKALPNRAINAELTGKIVSKSPRLSLATQFPALPLPFGLEFKEAGSTLAFPNFRFDSGNTKPITTITIEAWVRYTFGNGFIVSHRDDVKKGFSIGFEDERLFVELQGDGKLTRVEMELRFPTDLIWHHVAVTWNSKSIWMYLDGHIQPIVVVQADKAKSMMLQGRRRQIGLFESSIDLKDSTLYIGEWKDCKNYFHVAISEVRIWNTARTQDEIKVNQFCRLEGDEAGLVGYWRLDDGGQDNRVRDSSRNKADGESDSPTPLSWYPSSPSR